MHPDHKFEVVIAVNLKKVIGKTNRLPWKSPEDLAHFKALTNGHTIVMGRKTFESLGRRLPNRYHVVVSHNEAYRHWAYQPDLVVCDIEEALNLRKKEPVFLIGGAQVINEAFSKDLVRKIHLTTVFDLTEGDVVLPTVPEGFKLIQSTDRTDCIPELRFQVFTKQ